MLVARTDQPATPAKTTARKTAARKAAPRKRVADTPVPRAPEPLPAPRAAQAADTPAPTARVHWVRQACRLTPSEYEALSALKKRASRLARPTKRGRLLRAGLYALQRMSDDELFALLDSVPEPGA